ncbi:MAG: DUF2085 domain-containing protein [Clostridiales bacterium]|nr:DUF2085 domain-containing protein [Clostridiales bacterium]
MEKKIKIWIKSMELCERYWGCHQMSERSLFIRGYQMPVCARCTGIIFGEIISFILFMFNYRLNYALSLLMLLPMVADGLIQYFTKYLSNNIKRLFTGFIFGIGFMQILCYIIYSLIHII